MSYQFSCDHIAEMLEQAAHAARAASALSRVLADVDAKIYEHTHGDPLPGFDIDAAKKDAKQLRMRIHRLLTGAKVNAGHARSEIDDEKFKFQYGGREAFKP